MKKYIALFVFVLGLTATTFANPVNDPPCEMEMFTLGKITLTAGTLIYLETNERLMTDQATVGKVVQFKVTKNVLINGKVVVRTGAIAAGRIKSLQEATYNNPAEITIELKSVQAVDGQLVDLNGTEQTMRGIYPNQGTLINIGASITANVMNDTEVKI